MSSHSLALSKWQRPIHNETTYHIGVATVTLQRTLWAANVRIQQTTNIMFSCVVKKLTRNARVGADPWALRGHRGLVKHIQNMKFITFHTYGIPAEQRWVRSTLQGMCATSGSTPLWIGQNRSIELGQSRKSGDIWRIFKFDDQSKLIHRVRSISEIR